MKNRQVVLAVDQGTTGSRAILYDRSGTAVSSAYQEFRQHYPQPGWVEHDPEEIWRSTLQVIASSLAKSKRRASDIAAIGITNQRETTVLWDKRTGRPVHRAIVWQDRRTAEFCETLKRRGYEKEVRQKTGLVIDAYFSGTKVSWLFGRQPRLRSLARRGALCFGTIDSWLLYKLTGGRSHATDVTNASRTLMFNIVSQKWDSGLLRMLGVPPSVLPEVKSSAGSFGETVKQGPLVSGIPVCAMMGDQQAALYGQSCYGRGQWKNTYGTGCFIMLNAGKKWVRPPHGLLTTVACDREGKPAYALEGAIFIGGAAVQWLRDGLGFFKKASETERLIRGLSDTGGVVVIPAFVGLGSPYWNSRVRGMMTGITRGTTKAHIIRATLESLAHQTADVADLMKSKLGYDLRELRVDGGATANRFLMQFQADILGIPVRVSSIAESTAWGAAKLAGRKAGFWSWDSSVDQKIRYRTYRPRLGPRDVQGLRQSWQKAVQHLLASAKK